jgi:hypothetical protein
MTLDQDRKHQLGGPITPGGEKFEELCIAQLPERPQAAERVEVPEGDSPIPSSHEILQRFILQLSLNIMASGSQTCPAF